MGIRAKIIGGKYNMTMIYLRDWISQLILLMSCWLITIVGMKPFNSNAIFLVVCFVFLYVIGLILIPESRWYKRIHKEKLDAIEQERRDNRLKQLNRHIDKLDYGSERNKAVELVNLCHRLKDRLKDDVLKAKVDETLDIYFNLVDVQLNCVEFAKTENKSTIDKKIEINETRLKQETDERIKDSIKNILMSLSQRRSKLDDAIRNEKIIELEKERLIEQIKLLYADSMTNLNSRALTTKMESNFKMINQIKSFVQDLNAKLDL